MSAEDITARVQRGAALLDEKRPGWWQEIDLGRLDIGSGCNCIAGQLGGYGTVILGLGIPSYAHWGEGDHGFAARDGLTEDEDEAEYVALTATWRDLITSRRLAVEVTA